MTFTEILIMVLNSDFAHILWIVISILMVFLGFFIIIGIKTTGRIILIDQIFKKKNFKREELNHKYMIQGIYTIALGIILLIVLLTIPFNGVVMFPILMAFAVLDFLYDYFAITSSTKKEKLDEE
jgi:hypothetical protein